MIRYPKDMAAQRNVRWFASVVVILTVLGSGYFAVSSLVDPGGLVPDGDQRAARIFAAYVAVRGVVLLGSMVWLLAVRSWRPLGLLLLLNATVQIGDAVIGAVLGQVPQTIGPLVFAAAMLAATWLLGGLTLTPGRRAVAAQV